MVSQLISQSTQQQRGKRKRNNKLLTLHTAAVASSGDVFFVADLLYLQMAHENGEFVKAAAMGGKHFSCCNVIGLRQII